MSQVKVALGQHEYTVHPQRHAYLRHRLGGELEGLAEVEAVADGNLLDQVIEKAYEFLSVFIPDLMPQWEFEGYGSPSAFEAREYDEAADRSPSPDQIIGAFEMALRVNRLDLVKHLKTWIGEDYLRAQIQMALGTMTQKALASSETSALENGESPSPSSTTIDPTPMPHGPPDLTTASPSSDSPGSSTPESTVGGTTP